MFSVLPTIKNLELNGKKIFLRADLNVPIKNGQILQDLKIRATLPSIDYILKNGGKIVLATHIGSPDAGNPEDLHNPNYSTAVIAKWLQARRYKVEFHPDLMKAKIQSPLMKCDIILLENLRFFKGEKTASFNFAEELASLANVYVNDAFGSLHRGHASIKLLPTLFTPNQRAFGFLVEQELAHLSKLKENAVEPFVLVIGGAKVKDKVPMLERFIISESKCKPSSILIGGAVANAFLATQGYYASDMAQDHTAINAATKVLDAAKANKVKIFLPSDLVCQISQQTPQNYTYNKIPPTAECYDIGQAAVESFKAEIASAKTIFTNGTMGVYGDPKFEQGTKAILELIANNTSAYRVVGGGDATAAAIKFGLYDKFNFVSTGGGATSFFKRKKARG